MREPPFLVLSLSLAALCLVLRAPPTVGQELRPHDGQRQVDSMVALFYRRQNGHPVWIQSGRPSADATSLVSSLLEAGKDGLESSDYGAQSLARDLESVRPLASWGLIDSTLTRAFFEFARDLSLGRVRPETGNRSWRGSAKTVDFVQMVEASLASGEIRQTLERLAPTHAGYRKLREALAHYRGLVSAGGWPGIPAGPAIQPGDEDWRLPTLRRRLSMENFDAGRLDSAEFYDVELETQVRKYQELRGLTVDGIIGPATVASLNVGPAARVRQIIVNLERWRWLPRALERPYVMVNTAGFLVDYVADDTSGLTSRVIVGRKDWPTPIVSSAITAVVFRPSWSVPHSIAGKELLPLIRANPGYLREQGFRVFKGKQEVNPAAVEWRSIGRRSLSYRFVQKPGPLNPLGGVKLQFDSDFGVYLHDTPSRSLFELYPRRLSHGCVRVERVTELVARLLPGWSLDSVLTEMQQGEEHRVPLPAAVPVHLVYWTAWVDAAGVQFRDDGYGWDSLIQPGVAESPCATPVPSYQR